MNNRLQREEKVLRECLRSHGKEVVVQQMAKRRRAQEKAWKPEEQQKIATTAATEGSEKKTADEKAPPPRRRKLTRRLLLAMLPGCPPHNVRPVVPAAWVRQNKLRLPLSLGVLPDERFLQLHLVAGR